ncbi:MAG: hypothetical protein HY658_07705, partial [Actinobacteria bacterium]|nr:hypothetical protein [Actinomycetota bacterium]
MRGATARLAAAAASVLVSGAAAWIGLWAGGPVGTSGPVGGSPEDPRPEHPRAPAFAARTVADGSWSDPATWSSGRPPGEADAVLVAHDVSLDGPDVRVGPVWVTGSLILPADRSTAITLSGSLVALDGGLVRAGSPDRPVASGSTATVRFDGPERSELAGGPDFEPDDVGLWVLDRGRLELHGAPVRGTWGELAATAPAGSREVVLEGDVTDWPTPSRVVVTATNATRDDENEAVGVLGAEPAGGGRTRLLLDRPLSFEHLGEPGRSGEVGLLTRNVTVESVDPARPGHVAFLAGARGGISYTAFRDLGPEDVLGRYTLHFHLMGDSSRGTVVRGSSFESAGGFWLNIHGSNGITAVDNVGFGARGSGFYMEKPAGWDNLWLHNLGVSVAPSENLRHRNAVFWLLLGNRLVGNVAVGAQQGADASGFFLPQVSRDEPAYERPTVVLHNEAHSNRRYGFASWMNLSPTFDVVDVELWRNAEAGLFWGAYGTHMRAFRIRSFDNAEADLEAQAKGLHLQDSLLSGAPVGMFIANPVTDTNPERPSVVVRTSLDRHGRHDVGLDAQRECDRDTNRCPPVYASFVDSAFGSPVPVRFGWQWDPGTVLAFRDARMPERPDLPGTFVLRRPDLD